MKLMIMGYGGHGKDTVARILQDAHGMTVQSSSMAAAEKFVWAAMKPIVGYQSPQQCHDDRRNHRALWYEMIKLYNRDDKARLIREVLAESDVYCGIRDPEEFLAAKDEGLFDYAVWVHAFDRVPTEDPGSCPIDPSYADVILDNSGPESSLRGEVADLVQKLKANRLDRRVSQ